MSCLVEAFLRGKQQVEEGNIESSLVVVNRSWVCISEIRNPAQNRFDGAAPQYTPSDSIRYRFSAIGNKRFVSVMFRPERGRGREGSMVFLLDYPSSAQFCNLSRSQHVFTEITQLLACFFASITIEATDVYKANKRGFNPSKEFESK